MRSRTRRVFSLVAVPAVVLGALVIEAPPAEATYPCGSSVGCMWDYGANSSRWEVDWIWSYGQDERCAPDALGDGWQCTAEVANQIRYAAQADRDLGPASISGISLNLYSSPDASGAGPFAYRDGISASCSPPSSRCGNPYGSDISDQFPGPSSGWRPYNFTIGACFYVKGSYGYKVGSTTGTQGIPSDSLSGTYPYQGLNGTRNGGLCFDAIDTVDEHRAPQARNNQPTRVPPSGVGVVNPHQVFSMTVTSPDGNNWTGTIRVQCTNGLDVTDNLGGLKYRSGMSASSKPIQMRTVTGSCTVTGRATDTSGTSTNQGSDTDTYAY